MNFSVLVLLASAESQVRIRPAGGGIGKQAKAG